MSEQKKDYTWRVGDVFTNGNYRWAVDSIDGEKAVLRSCGSSWATTKPLTVDEWHEGGRWKLVTSAKQVLPNGAHWVEEFVPHPFNSRTPYEPGDDRDIWCKDCEYHRDHQIHQIHATVDGERS